MGGKIPNMPNPPPPPPRTSVPLHNFRCDYCWRPVDGSYNNCVGCGAPVPTGARVLGIEINADKLLETAPEYLRFDPVARSRWLQEVVSEVERFYKSLGPGDAFIHTNVLTVTYRNPELERR